MSVDSAKNAAVYGSMTPRQILDGTIDPPPEMQVHPGLPASPPSMHPLPGRLPARPASQLAEHAVRKFAALTCSSTAAACHACQRPGAQNHALLLTFPPLVLQLPLPHACHPCPQPLYSELALIVHQATSEVASSAPGRVSASLERYSTGGWVGGWAGCWWLQEGPECYLVVRRWTPE